MNVAQLPKEAGPTQRAPALLVTVLESRVCTSRDQRLNVCPSKSETNTAATRQGLVLCSRSRN